MPHDNDQKPAPRSLGLSPAQIAGSALSAVSAAFVASWAGTTGTLIGAAVGSIVATIGAALYTASLRRSSAAVRRAAAQVRQTSLLTGSMTRPLTPLETDTDDRVEPNADRDDAVTSSEAVSWRDRLPWGKALVASLAVMVVALGGITAVEAITGHPISSWLGRNDSTGTTLGNVGGSDHSSTKNTGTDQGTTDHDQGTTPSQEARPSQSADPQPAPQPSQVPSQVPSTSASADPSTAP